MVAPNARDVLKKENELLNELAKKASASADIGAGWAKFFNGWRENNEKLMGMSDSALAQELKEEIKRLEGMRNSIPGDSAGVKYWKDALGDDIANLKEML